MDTRDACAVEIHLLIARHARHSLKLNGKYFEHISSSQ